MKQVEVFCINTNETHYFGLGTSLLEISEQLNIKTKNRVCGAIVNHQVQELSFCMVKPKQIEFFDVSHPYGIRMYARSLIFVLYTAAKKVFPNVSMRIRESISNGYFCEFNGLENPITGSEILTLKQEMNNIISANIPFVQKEMKTGESVQLLKEQGLSEKALLFEQQGHLYSDLYFLNAIGNFLYGQLLPSTGYITNFDLVPYYDGLLLQIPQPNNFNQLNEIKKLDKLFGIYKERKDWAKILNVSVVSNLNSFTMQKKGGEIIKISEALHEKKIAEIANLISYRRGQIKLVLIAGPSASGKTTFSKRLGIQLAVNGIKSYQISVDNYFVDSEKTPLDEYGNYDYESLGAVDVEFFNNQLLSLFNGEEVQLPKFDFLRGKRYFDGDRLKLNDQDILIVEGIHGMNPDLIPEIDKKNTFKIFISALTQISFDEHTLISTTDNRLIRRIIRDSQYRGYNAADTIKRWPSVIRGEERNIFPYQENADVMFNSATLYELAVLKKYAEPLLKLVPENQIEYAESVRLLRFFSYFKPIDDGEIPPTSLLREFLGGSSFVY
ncbi:MAG: nucleoside kinase [Bacteroidales bacterium]|jgi:uridine kinase|nr:nucleoside kinase [Bacteroidales bacterium]